jgi:hypothetical protein
MVEPAIAHQSSTTLDARLGCAVEAGMEEINPDTLDAKVEAERQWLVATGLRLVFLEQRPEEIDGHGEDRRGIVARRDLYQGL